MERLAERGVRICVISAEDSPAMAARIRKLGISEYHAGIKNKLALLTDKAASWGASLEQIAVIGDDLGDLELIERAGISFCPADAVPEVRARADYICRANGGSGAVREACDLICAAKLEQTGNADNASPTLANG